MRMWKQLVSLHVNAQSDSSLYYPPRNVFDPYMGIYGAGCIFFVYTSALVPWIISVNNFRFSNNISETMLHIDMYNISLERSFYSASDRVSCIKIHAEIKALFIFTGACGF